MLGVVLCLVSAVVYSISLILQKPLVARLPAIHVTWLACTIGAVVCLPFAGQLVDETRRRAGLRDLVGRLPRRLPDRDRVHDVRLRAPHMSASSLGVTTYLVPPITIVMGWLFLDEAPPDDGVRRRRARAGRRGRGPAQAADARRRGRPPGLRPAMLLAVNIVADVLVGLVAALHLYFLVLEMFLWDNPTGHKTFGLDPGVRRARARCSPPTRGSTTASWSRGWSGGWSTDLTT